MFNDWQRFIMRYLIRCWVKRTWSAAETQLYQGWPSRRCVNDASVHAGGRGFLIAMVGRGRSFSISSQLELPFACELAWRSAYLIAGAKWWTTPKPLTR